MKKEKEKLPTNEEQNQSGEVSRRDFLVGAGTVVVGGAIGAGLLSSCKGETTTVTQTTTKTVPTTVTTTVGGAGTTVTETKTVGGEGAVTVTQTKTVTEGGSGVYPSDEPEISAIRSAAMIGVAGGEPMSVDIKNNRVIRCRPLQYLDSYSQEELNECNWELNARGKTFKPINKSLPSYFAFGFKHRAYSPNRVKYPLKRVDWEPGGVNVNPQNRGISKFKRISWDEATEMVASEIVRIEQKYSTKAWFIHSRMHGTSKTVHMMHLAHMNVLALFGDFTSYDNNPDSWEGWFWGGKHVGGAGTRGLLQPSSNVYKDVCENTEMIVWQAGDWETTPSGFEGMWSTRLAYFLTEIGIKNIYICPELNFAASVHADKWIPILPDTDAAMQLAIIYTWLEEDTYDKDYVATHVYRPEDFFAYVKGETDGIPKTPAWAAAKCGVNEWTIKALARQWAKKVTSTGNYYGGSFIRGPYSSEPARLAYCQLAMQGLGKPGVQQLCYLGQGLGGASGRYGLMTVSMSGKTGLAKMIITSSQHIALTKLPEAIINGHLEFWGGGMAYEPVADQFIKRVYPAETDGMRVHFYWTDCPCMTTCWNEGNYWIEMFRDPSIEFMLAPHPWFENDCLFADIVLPSTTVFEDEDMVSGGARGALYMYRHAIPAVGESKSDWEIGNLICKAIEKYGGIYADAYARYNADFGDTVEQRIQACYELSPGVNENMSLEELDQRGYFLPKSNPKWGEAAPGLRKFYEDPTNNPRDLPSGKLEFYSDGIAETFPDDKERPPYPVWVEGGAASEGWAHDERIGGERSKKYPLLLESNHPRWRHHAQADDIPWIREIPTCKVKGYDGYMYECVWLNPTDAAPRGIESGDIIKIYNERGITLGGAFVTERVSAGTVHMDHGCRIDRIADRIDRGGANNLISPYACTGNISWGQATSGYLVEVEKLDPAEMEEWKESYPEAFAKEYDPAYGLHTDAWIAEGGDE